MAGDGTTLRLFKHVVMLPLNHSDLRERIHYHFDRFTCYKGTKHGALNPSRETQQQGHFHIHDTH